MPMEKSKSLILRMIIFWWLNIFLLTLNLIRMYFHWLFWDLAQKIWNCYWHRKLNLKVTKKKFSTTFWVRILLIAKCQLKLMIRNRKLKWNLFPGKSNQRRTSWYNTSRGTIHFFTLKNQYLLIQNKRKEYWKVLIIKPKIIGCREYS